MALCASGILLAAMISIIILNDMYSNRIGYVIEHSVLGGIACILFSIMCNYGLEIINWVFLLLIPAYLLLSWWFIPEDECEIPETNCDCSEVKSEPKKLDKSCPAKPILLSTECGISRFS